MEWQGHAYYIPSPIPREPRSICQFGKIPRLPTLTSYGQYCAQSSDLSFPHSGCGRSEDGGHSEAAIRMFEQLRLVIRCLNDSGSGSEEENMSNIALSHKAAKLMKLCDLEGYKRLHDLLKARRGFLFCGCSASCLLFHYFILDQPKILYSSPSLQQSFR
jgi:hypothetical protein